MRFPKPQRQGYFFVGWSDHAVFYLVRGTTSGWLVYRASFPLPPGELAGRWECDLSHWLHYTKRGVYDWMDQASEGEIQRYIKQYEHDAAR